MNKNQKQEQVQRFGDKLSAATSAFLVDYRGLKVEEVNVLRGKLREVGVEYRVGKNTLLKRAVQNTAMEPLEPFLEGPTAIAIVDGEPVAAAKVLAEYAKEKKSFDLKVACVDGRILIPAEIERLSQLPSREVLLAKLLGTLNAPTSNFVGVLAAIPGSLVRVLAAIRDQKQDN
ncbi:MAG: 50S ribosomal protein L10 [Desulfuromonadaceae bacterium]|nr:50S ribosomal protein L10 [Desulfuromonadaceae bacterium]